MIKQPQKWMVYWILFMFMSRMVMFMSRMVNIKDELSLHFEKLQGDDGSYDGSHNDFWHYNL